MNDYTQLIGTERPGMMVTTTTDLKLNNIYLSDVPEELKLNTIPKGNKGHVQEISAADYKLHFLYNDKYNHTIQQAVFRIRKAYFDKFFTK